MTDAELLELMGLNSKRFENEKNALYDEFIKMDQFIKDGFKKNAIHRHFKTKKEMQEVMGRDFNPWNTFSYGKKDPTPADGKAISPPEKMPLPTLAL